MSGAIFRPGPSIQLVVAVCLLSTVLFAQQMPDPNFDATVARPAYTPKSPTVAIDEAHANFHTAGGRYKPLADLLKSDGYRVLQNTSAFTTESLKTFDILIISNAVSADATDDTSPSAFTEAECEVIKSWVDAGGSLLLIADHTPFGSAAASLGARFGIVMGKGYVYDFANADTGPAVLRFSRANSLLGDHVITRGRDQTEVISKVVAFTGQSLSVPKGATSLLKLSDSACEAPTRTQLQEILAPANTEEQKRAKVAANSSSAAGRSQGLAMTFGKGKLVVLGEAAMFSAQVFKAQGPNGEQEFKMGMNVPGNDDRQFALNVLHWLSGALK